MQQVVWDVVEPGLVALGVYTPPDPTYGRYLLPQGPVEKAIDTNPSITLTQRRLFFPAGSSLDTTEVEFTEYVELKEEELSKERRRGGRWVYYKTWEMQGGERKGKGVDVIMTHGLNDYGGRWAPHCMPFLEAGFRLIVPDLPSYGRSAGVHSHIVSPHQLTSALHAVLQDVVQVDVENGRKQRKVFLTGSSLGGWTCLYYLISFPPTQDIQKILDAPYATPDHEHPKSTDYRPAIAGAFILCPAVAVAPESRPNAVVEGIGRILVKFAGTLPLTHAIKGKGRASDDPRVEEEFLADPMTYHGKLRPSTGLSLLEGMSELEQKAEQITCPIRIIHGDKDRVTSHLTTMKFFERISSKDKELQIYEGYEHIMNKVGIDEADDAKRQAVLKDWVGWLLSRAAA